MIRHAVKFDALVPNIKSLKANLVKKHLRRAVTIASRPVQKDAKTQAQAIRKRGFLAKSMGTKVKTYGNGTVVSIIGVRTDKKYTYGVFVKGKNKGKPKIAFPAKYVHFLEYGTKHAAKNPIISRAGLRNHQQFQATVKKEFWDAIEKELQKN